jgi:epoxyqueuosine reductase
MLPTFSHRYTATAAGLGSIGWSGNLVSPDFGARVVLDSVITDTELPADPMLESSPCDGCQTCVSVCQSGYINSKESHKTAIGGKTFVHKRHGNNIRCTFVFGGFSGQSRYTDWSNWSAGRVRLPVLDKDIKE